jgi:peptide chain release factor
MKDSIYIIMTAGRGPVECEIAVLGIQKRLIQFMKELDIGYEIISQKKGTEKGTMETTVFEVDKNRKAQLTPWIGTIQWICQSPIRTYNKRKNWFIKCDLIVLQDKISINTADVIFQTFRASGPGGQHRNKVETAVRLTHKASGLMVTATDGKSQAQNKKKAWDKLEIKLSEMNQIMQKEQNFDQWIKQIDIERGSPVKVFSGMRFLEK